MNATKPNEGAPLDKLAEMGLYEGGRLIMTREQAIVDLGEVFGLSDAQVEEKFPGLFHPAIIEQGEPIAFDLKEVDGGLCTVLFVKNQPVFHHGDNPETFLYTVTLRGPKSPCDDSPVESWRGKEEEERRRAA